jgi:predicted alpha/beta hydrolase family esterase
VVASRDDPFASFGRVREMAGNWMASLCDAGEIGHINGGSGIGGWREGQLVLDRLLDHVCAREERRLDDYVVMKAPEQIAVVPA